MAFGSNIVHSFSAKITDPGADDKQLHIFRAPTALEILRAYIVVQNAQGAGSAGEFALHIYDTAGTGLAGTVAAAKGGTASAARLSAETPAAFTISEGTLSAGQWLVVDYQETGDWVEQQVTIVFDYVLGIGA